jgi:putative Holliday junction resolvase
LTRLLGIDLGQQRIGLAVADTDSGRINPLGIIRRSIPERDRTSLMRLVREQSIDEIVIGLPISLDGSHGPQAKATHEWADAVLGGTGMPLAWRDERLTTERAIERLGGPGRGASGGPPSGSARRSHRARLDREAAALILQAELDARSDVTTAAR